MINGPSKYPEYTPTVSAEEQIARLERSVRQLLEEVERLPSMVLYREPQPGEWPVMSTLAHLEELLPYWAREAAQVAATPNQALGRTHDDPRRIGAIAEHGHDTLDAIVPRIRLALTECVRTLRSIPSDAWSRTGQHPRRGQMSVADVVQDFLVNHAEEHAAQIQAALKDLEPSPRP